MHNSADRVNTRCLRRSVRPCGALGLPRRRAAAMTWDFMDCLDLMQRCGGWVRCVACIIVAPAGIAMHPGAAGCIWCITGGPGERCPAGTASARDAPGLRVIGHVTRLTWQPAVL